MGLRSTSAWQAARAGRVALALLVVAASLSVLTPALGAAPSTTALVLGPLDLPAGIALGTDMSNGRPLPVDAWSRAHGCLGGSETTLPLRSAPDGLRSVTSQAYRFRTGAGAASALARYGTAMTDVRKPNGDVVPFRRLPPPAALGRGARMAWADVGGSALYAVIWRQGSVIGQQLVMGVTGKVRRSDVARLARAQQAKIAAALR